ncbi:hypothetical protein CVIRNUC_000710 [Coccomyxa viridis]|uniref:Uncharacterized protein n=1 Tax=Coccomyxa viridis TaxID=1274662 RepID=A0AAV1HR27_9CHLO|nr:hypothetical protein CVIRNUC_000710 [Coccomyxa viridis]
MLRQGWAPGQHRLPDMLGMGHTPAVHSGRTRLLEQSQLRGVVRLRCLHAHGASMRSALLCHGKWHADARDRGLAAVDVTAAQAEEPVPGRFAKDVQMTAGLQQAAVAGGCLGGWAPHLKSEQRHWHGLATLGAALLGSPAL